MSSSFKNPTRRTLVKGAAWSVPVVAMASPAMAVNCTTDPSRPECGCLATASVASCKWEGRDDDPRFDKTFRARICFNANQCPTVGSGTAEIDFTAITLGGSGCPRDAYLSDTHLSIPRNAQGCTYLFFRADSSGNRSVTLTYSLNGGAAIHQITINLGFSTSCSTTCTADAPCPNYTTPAGTCDNQCNCTSQPAGLQESSSEDKSEELTDLDTQAEVDEPVEEAVSEPAQEPAPAPQPEAPAEVEPEAPAAPAEPEAPAEPSPPAEGDGSES
ncbi:hypothetical protein [Ornithinimicrobium sp. Y1694]|uniref:hypothetical protein n=1 Tax=Ornithinimicrobium sp. Y1694 TaxID=3418590 RepID=UPI003CF3A242